VAVATIAKTQAAQVRPIVATFALASLAGALITWKFIFPVPAAFGAILTVLLALARFATSSTAGRVAIAGRSAADRWHGIRTGWPGRRRTG
jgi:hypothetical protein